MRGRERPWMVLGVTLDVPAALALSSWPIRKGPAFSPYFVIASIAVDALAAPERTRACTSLLAWARVSILATHCGDTLSRRAMRSLSHLKLSSLA